MKRFCQISEIIQCCKMQFKCCHQFIRNAGKNMNPVEHVSSIITLQWSAVSLTLNQIIKHGEWVTTKRKQFTSPFLNLEKRSHNSLKLGHMPWVAADRTQSVTHRSLLAKRRTSSSQLKTQNHKRQHIHLSNNKASNSTGSNFKAAHHHYNISIQLCRNAAWFSNIRAFKGARQQLTVPSPA